MSQEKYKSSLFGSHNKDPMLDFYYCSVIMIDMERRDMVRQRMHCSTGDREGIMTR